MSYNINFTDQINNSPLVVNDNTINTATSLGFPGRNQKGYAITIGEDLLHLLENFSSTSSPLNPIKGQLWYDSSEGNQTLMVYDGTSWKSSGSLRKGTNSPIGSNSILGDLWVDTGNQQLYLYNGSSWILVGPTVVDINGRTTGSLFETYQDSSTLQTNHTVLKNVVADTVVSIVSTTSFTPKSSIPGFNIIKAGVNLNYDSYKYWGISEKAESLIVGSNTVPAANFLRSDVANITNNTFTIRSNSGLNLGDNSQLQVRVTDGKGVIYQSSANSRLDLRVNAGAETTLVSLDAASGNIGIGAGAGFTETLTVNGSGSFTNNVTIKDTTDSTDANTGSLISRGGAYIKKTLRIDGDIITGGQITSNSIIPNDVNISNLGSLTNTFANVYASNFIGNLRGNVTGNIIGNVSGAASRLISSTTFSMTGHVSSSGFTFDGSTITVQAGAFIVGQQYKIATLGTTTDWNLAAGTNGLTYAAGTIFTAVTVGSGDGTVTTLVNKVFNTTISGDFINTQSSTQLTADTDEIMIYRPIVVGSSQPNPYKITKADFLNNLSLVPVGSIFPFAGSVVPPGYLLCDGSEKSIAQYHLLFDVVGTTYTPNPNNLVGVNTFRLPDLRGRFPLGLLNMDNGDAVKDGDGNNINSGGGDPTGEIPSTPRVTASTASTLGNTSGSDQITLAVSQLPDHQHNLVGNTGEQYFAINNNTQAPSDQDSELLSISGNNSVQALPHSGGVKSSTVAQPVSIANPYLTINYIIYSGVHS